MTNPTEIERAVLTELRLARVPLTVDVLVANLVQFPDADFGAVLRGLELQGRVKRKRRCDGVEGWVGKWRCD